MYLGLYLRELRRDKSISQRYMIMEMGIDSCRFSQIENCWKAFTEEEMRDYCALIDIEPDPHWVMNQQFIKPTIVSCPTVPPDKREAAENHINDYLAQFTKETFYN